METCPLCAGTDVEVLDKYEGVSLIRTRRCRGCLTLYIPPAPRKYYFWVLPLGLVVAAGGVGALVALPTVLGAGGAGASGGGAGSDTSGIVAQMLVAAGGLLAVGGLIAREGWRITTGKSGRILQEGLVRPPKQ